MPTHMHQAWSYTKNMILLMIFMVTLLLLVVIFILPYWECGGFLQSCLKHQGQYQTTQVISAVMFTTGALLLSVMLLLELASLCFCFNEAVGCLSALLMIVSPLLLVLGLTVFIYLQSRSVSGAASPWGEWCYAGAVVGTTIAVMINIRL